MRVGPPEGRITCDVGDRTTFAIVDWNNDGRADMVLGGLDGKVHVLLNEATASIPDFRSDTIVLDGADPHRLCGQASVAVVDLNDNRPKNYHQATPRASSSLFANIDTIASPQFNGSQLLQADGAVIDLSGIPRYSRPVCGRHGWRWRARYAGRCFGRSHAAMHGARTSGATG